MKTWWRCGCLLGTSPPRGGLAHVDFMLLQGYVADAVLAVKDEYSDALAASLVEPPAFQAILDSKALLHKRTGTAIWLFGMKCAQRAIDSRDPESTHGLRLFFVALGCFLLLSFDIHPDTIQNLHAFFFGSILLLGRESDVCKKPSRASTRNQEIYHSAVRSKSHMHEVTLS